MTGVSLELVRAHLATDPNRRLASGRGWSVYRHGLPARSFERRTPVNTLPPHGWGWLATLAVWCGRGQAGGDPLGTDAQSALAARWWRGKGPKYGHGVRRRAPARVSRATAPARAPRGKRAAKACASGCAKGTQSVTQTAGAPVAQTGEGPEGSHPLRALGTDSQNESEKGRS